MLIDFQYTSNELLKFQTKTIPSILAHMHAQTYTKQNKTKLSINLTKYIQDLRGKLQNS